MRRMEAKSRPWRIFLAAFIERKKEKTDHYRHGCQWDKRDDRVHGNEAALLKHMVCLKGGYEWKMVAMLGSSFKDIKPKN